MLVWCDLNKRTVLTELVCYCCEDKIVKTEYCQYFKKIEDVVQKELEEGYEKMYGVKKAE
jgi:hypothetical protein